MIDNPLKLGGSLAGLTSGKVRRSPNLDGVQCAVEGVEADAAHRKIEAGSGRQALDGGRWIGRAQREERAQRR
jgi:hypothetical protein